MMNFVQNLRINNEEVNGLVHQDSLVAQWLERPTSNRYLGVLEAIGSIPLLCPTLVTNISFSSKRAFSYDVRAVTFLFQNKETEAILLYQANPRGVKLYFYAKNRLLSW